jgi:hypothetical protein
MPASIAFPLDIAIIPRQGAHVSFVDRKIESKNCGTALPPP